MKKHDQIVRLLNAINGSSVNGVPMHDLQIFGNYNVWHFFQQRLYRHCESFVEGTYTDEKKLTAGVWFKNVFIYSFALTITLFSWLSCIIKKREVLIFSVDKDSSAIAHNDFRINDLYALLLKHSISYLEVFYSLLNIDLLKYALHRKRASFYLRGIDALYLLRHPFGDTKQVIDTQDLSMFTDKEQALIKTCATRYLNTILRVKFRTKILTRFLRLSGAKLLLSIDDARDYHETLLAAKLCGIPSYAFQHGFYGSVSVGWFKGIDFAGELVTPDRLYVWSDYWRDVLKKFDSVFPTIMTGGLPKITEPLVKKIDSTGLTILFPYEARAYHEQVAWYIKKALESIDVKIIFKTRPDRPAHLQLAEYGLKEIPGRLISEPDTKKALEQSDIVLGTYSTFLYDMVAVDMPIVIVETDSEMGEDLVGSSFATLIKKTDDVYQKLSEAKRIPHEVRERLRIKLIGSTPKLLSNTLEEVALEHGLLIVK